MLDSRCMSVENRAYTAHRIGVILRCRPRGRGARRLLLAEEPLEERGDDDAIDEVLKVWIHNGACPEMRLAIGLRSPIAPLHVPIPARRGLFALLLFLLVPIWNHPPQLTD